jgi:hypothetical protein
VAVLAALLGGLLATATVATTASATPTDTIGVAAPSASGATIRLTADTGEGPRSIQDPRHAVMVHLEGETGIAIVTVEIDPELTSFFGYLGTLEAQDAPLGRFTDDCSSTSITVTDVFRCTVNVPIRLGANRIDFVLKSFGTDQAVAHGVVYGVGFGAEVTFQSQRPDGLWVDFPEGDELVAPGTTTTGLRYAVHNVGNLPFRAEGSCSDAMIEPDDQLVCVVRGPRPVFALLGDYHLPLRIRDLSGAVEEVDLTARVRAGTPEQAARLATAGYPPTVARLLEFTGGSAATSPEGLPLGGGAVEGAAPASREAEPTPSTILAVAGVFALLGVLAFVLVRQAGRSSSTRASVSGSSIRSSGSIVGGGEGSSSSSSTSRSSSEFGS